MWKPAWKSIAEHLERESYGNSLAKTVMPGVAGDVQAEILAEMATALGRAQAKVRSAIAALEPLSRACKSAPTWDGRNEARRAFNAQRQLALEARWELLVHREALGFLRNGHLERDYPIPPER